jgi:hypothetical protein
MTRTEVGITTVVRSSFTAKAHDAMRVTEVGMTIDFSPDMTPNILSLMTEMEVGIEA